MYNNHRDYYTIMSPIQFPANLSVVRSPKGKEILRGLLELSKNEEWWGTASRDDIHTKIKSIGGNTTKSDLQPKHCTSHTHRR